MSDEKHTSLSGVWTGVYDYPSGLFEPVPFNALLVEKAGSVQGECVEPNTISADPSRELFASFDGARAGSEVSFVKTYEDTGDLGHAIRYEGAVDATLTRIVGRWTTLERAGGWSGPFVMNRDRRAERAALERLEAAPRL